ncbi:hypothetical protein L1S45_16675 [Aeromonas dhakensis]|uniref:DUF2262 domain-containing protein n=1 Tax=Aeromonas dhakensis TaxID=196024 RepID=UPI00208DE135|nr:hypothetical protein [Aeromonas dhakensis]USP08795.1 hypothetical protein L1S45_16675 [Aeromonas dhakensis]
MKKERPINKDKKEVNSSSLQIQKNIVVTIKNQEPFTGIEKNYHANDQLMEERTYINGKKEGVERYYYISGQLASEVNYIKGKRDGFYKWYYENGQLCNEGVYKNGKKEGLHKHYYENRQLSAEASYKNGELEGFFKTYYENGKLKEHSTYKNGEMEGFYKLYNISGQLTEEIIYKNGKIIELVESHSLGGLNGVGHYSSHIGELQKLVKYENGKVALGEFIYMKEIDSFLVSSNHLGTEVSFSIENYEKINNEKAVEACCTIYERLPEWIEKVMGYSFEGLIEMAKEYGWLDEGDETETQDLIAHLKRKIAFRIGYDGKITVDFNVSDLDFTMEFDKEGNIVGVEFS